MPAVVGSKVFDELLGGVELEFLGNFCALKLVLDRLYRNVGAMLWLDSDAVPKSDISWLFSDDNPFWSSGMPYAMCEDGGAGAVGLPGEGNCGVTLFNLDAVRSSPDTMETVLSLFKGDAVRPLYREQDALSLAGFHRLPPEWNACLGEHFEKYRLSDEGVRRAESARIVHFTWRTKEAVPCLPPSVESIVSDAIESASRSVDLGDMDYRRFPDGNLMSKSANLRLGLDVSSSRPDPSSLPPVTFIVNDATRDYFEGGARNMMMSVARRSSVTMSFLFVGHGLEFTSANEKSFLEIAREVEGETGVGSSVSEATELSTKYLELVGGAGNRLNAFSLSDMLFPPVDGLVVSSECDVAYNCDAVYRLSSAACLMDMSSPFLVLSPCFHWIEPTMWFTPSSPAMFNHVSCRDGDVFERVASAALSTPGVRAANDILLGMIAASGVMDVVWCNPVAVNVWPVVDGEMNGADPHLELYSRMNAYMANAARLLRTGDVPRFSNAEDMFSLPFAFHFGDKPKPWSRDRSKAAGTVYRRMCR